MYPQTMEKIANFIINVCNNTPVDGVYKGKIYEYYKTINIKNPKS